MPQKTSSVSAHEKTDAVQKPLIPENAAPLHPKDNVETAGRRMRERDASTWPVTKDQKLVGTVDDKDADLHLGGYGHDPRSHHVSQIMSRDFAYCYEDQDCVTAEKLMDERGLRYLPVVDRQMKIVGIFSKSEITEKAHAPDAAERTISQVIATPAPQK